jgi:MFS family permease
VASSLWSIALLRILLAQLAFGFSWCLFLVYPKFLASELAVGPSAIGSVGSVAGITSAISVLLVVRSIDQSRRAVFVCGCALLALSAFGYMWVERFGPLVYVLQAGVGASYAMAFNAAMASVTDVAAPERLGQAFGLQSAANLSMNAVSTLSAEYLAQHYGWRRVFAVSAGSALLALLFGLGLPSSRREGAQEAALATPPYRALLPVFASASLVGAAYVALATFHQPFALALGATRLSTFFAGFTGAALLMRLGFGNLGDRFGRRPVARLSLGVYAIVALSMMRLDPGWLWLYGAGFGLAHGVLYPTLIASAAERVPPGTQGRTIAAFSGAFSAGSAAGAAAWGALSQRCGYPPLFLGACSCTLVAAGLLSSDERGAQARAPR